MTRITFFNGKILFIEGRVATEKECCCCDLSSADTADQPSVAVATDCNCNAGTLDGSYSYSGLFFDGSLSWTGTTTCDWTGNPSDAPMTVLVSSDCLVTVATYQYPFQSLQGSVTALGLELDNNGNVVGTVSIPLFDFSNVQQCIATVTFSAP
jgi:hypothetical protein